MLELLFWGAEWVPPVCCCRCRPNYTGVWKTIPAKNVNYDKFLEVQVRGLGSQLSVVTGAGVGQVMVC